MEGSNTRGRRRKQQCLPPPQPNYPWLLYSNSKGKKNQTFCTISDPPKTYTRSIPELVGASKLWTLQHGWCLLANSIPNGGRKLFLWNPSSLQKFMLPTLTPNATIGDCILTSSPTTSTDQVCSILLFSYHSTSIFHCQLGDKHWTEVDYPVIILRYLLRISVTKGKWGNSGVRRTVLTNPVYCNGCLYQYIETWFGSYLVVIEFEKLEPHDGLKIKNSTYVHFPRSAPTNFHRVSRLLASNDELFRIEILHAQNKVIAVAVHRLNFSLKVWEKVEGLKDRVFFISNVDSHSSFVCEAINPEIEGGCIYIALGDNNFVYIYNIEDNTLMISQPFSNLPKNRSCSMWFMPDVRMTDLPKEEIGKAQIREKESICATIDSKETGDGATNEFALPLDMIEVIAKRLNTLDYLHFRATNKLFHLVAPPFHWRSCQMSESRFDDLSLCPLFVFLEKDNVLTLVHPKHGLKYKYTINLPTVTANDDSFDHARRCLKAGLEICYSKDGWLLLVEKTHFSFFFNPFIKQGLRLAHAPTMWNTLCVGFSHPPTSRECMIVQWDAYFSNDNNFPLCNISPSFYKGAFYYLSRKGKLGVITNRAVARKELEKPHAPCTGYFNSFLVECNGNLLSVFEGRHGKWVRVFKLNESRMTWIRVKNLENYMLFVGHTSFSAVANIPGMENKIYFPRFYDQSIVFYSLETNNYHTFKSEVVNFHHVKEQLNSNWIEPRWE